MSYKDWFIQLYFNKLRLAPLFGAMADMQENSPWHREDSVLVHTDMVIAQYLSNNNDDSTRAWLYGALTCAFHDVGKPSSVEYKHSEERGDYKSFGGHELVSARLWEDFATSNWFLFSSVLKVSDIGTVAWLIENHLPYKLKKDYKVNNMYAHNILATERALPRVLRADCWGRISDDHDKKKDDVEQWIFNFTNNNFEANMLTGALAQGLTVVSTKKPVLYMLIGASGSGKSTYTKELVDSYAAMDEFIFTYSLDQLRLNWYGDVYGKAWNASCEDKEFVAKTHKHFMQMIGNGHHMIVDNTNTSTKRRKFYLDNAKAKGYKTIAVTFPISISMLLERSKTRLDKQVPENGIRQQYMLLQQPMFGEFDEIVVCEKNLK